jgi:hypothetical protein
MWWSGEVRMANSEKRLSGKGAIRRMIERLRESSGGVLGFRVTDQLTDQDIKVLEPQIEFLLRERKRKPIGILVDLSAMHGAELKARWDELRFLQKHTDRIARMALVGADKWEEVLAILTAGAAVLEAETRYFDKSEMLRAWEWVRSAKHAENEPVRQISAGTGIWKDYHPEYTDL